MAAKLYRGSAEEFFSEAQQRESMLRSRLVDYLVYMKGIKEKSEEVFERMKPLFEGGYKSRKIELEKAGQTDFEELDGLFLKLVGEQQNL